MSTTVESSGSAASESPDELAKPVESVGLPKALENDGYDAVGDAEDDTCSDLFCY